MLENTQKIYQLILETEKKFNDEKAKLVKRRETLQKKIDSKVPFSSAAKKREARYEIEEIDSSLEELERDKKQAVLDLEVLPQLKKAHDEDSKTWESSNNKKIDKLLNDLDSKIIPLMNAAVNLENKLKEYDWELLPLHSYKEAHGERHVSERLKGILRAVHKDFDPRLIAMREVQKYNAEMNQYREEYRQKEIEETGAYHDDGGGLIILEETKYRAWLRKEYGE